MTDPAAPGQSGLNTAPAEDIRSALLAAALPHVPFDGWSPATFRAAAADAGVEPGLAKAVCPRGALDLAVAFHQAGDAAMAARLRAEPMAGLRFRDKVATAVRLRLELIEDKEVVRRGTTLFALPQNAPEGARLVWGTADRIWQALGDTSDDFNWYSKRATLSAVYAATVLFWLGDSSPGHQATWEFLDRRIDNVMQIEQLKAGVNKNPLLRGLFAGPAWVLGRIRPPNRVPQPDLPGGWSGRRPGGSQ